MVMLPPVVPIQSQPPRRELDRWRCVGFQAGCSRRGSRNSLLEARKAFHQLRRPWAWLSAVISCFALCLSCVASTRCQPPNPVLGKKTRSPARRYTWVCAVLRPPIRRRRRPSCEVSTALAVEEKRACFCL
jgi:hypothetical protein